MILVLCGTQKQSFARMIDEAKKLADEHEVIVQAGHTEYKSDKMEIFDFISSSQLEILYDKAQYIITHAGAGSMFSAIKSKKKTIVFPRMQKYGEHVDDHQLQLATKLANLGYLLVFHDSDEMIQMFEKLKKFNPLPYTLEGSIPTLIDEELEKML